MSRTDEAPRALPIGELATRFGCDVVGDPNVTVHRVATLSGAVSGELSFLANSKYRRFLENPRQARLCWLKMTPRAARPTL